MGVTPDRTPGSRLEEELILTDEADGDPVVIGAVRNVAGTLKAKDSIGVFNLRQVGGGGLPVPNEAGEILYACDATQFVQVRPLVSSEGWLLNDDGLLLAVG